MRTITSKPAIGGTALAAALLLPLLAAPPTAAADGRYEAETAMLSQTVAATNHTGYSGTGFVDSTNTAGSSVEFTVNTTAGSTSLALRYANGTTTDRPMDISVNGKAVASGVAFNGTGSWDTWATKTVAAQLVAGTNTVRATATTANGGPNLDYLDTGAPAAAVPRCRSAATNSLTPPGR